MKRIKTFENYKTHNAPFSDIEYRSEDDNSNNSEDIRFLRSKYRSMLDDKTDADFSLSQVTDMIKSGEMNDLIAWIDKLGRTKGSDEVYRMAIDKNREDIVEVLYDNGIRISDTNGVIDWCSSNPKCKIPNIKYLVNGLSR